MEPAKKSKIVVFVASLLCAVFLSSCFHIVAQEITVKSKFAKKYDCPRKEVKILDDDMHGRGDTYKLVGCGIRATYKGTKEIYTSAPK